MQADSDIRVLAVSRVCGAAGDESRRFITEDGPLRFYLLFFVLVFGKSCLV